MTTPFESSASVSTDASQASLASQQALVNGVQTQQQALSSSPAAAFPFQSVQQQQPPALQQAQTGLSSDERANYEGRIRTLMSEKDKALNERDKKIGELAALQAEYMAFKEMNSGSLNSAVEAGTKLVEENKRLAAEVASLKGQVVRANVLLQKPHLAPYQQFIPAQGTEEDLQNAITQLEQIRASDLQRNGAMFPQQTAQQSYSAYGQQPQPQQQQDPAAVLAALQQQRSNLPQSLVQGQSMMMPMMPGSQPGQMNPVSDLNPATRIQQLMKEAAASGNPADFERALEQAKVLANGTVR